MISMNGFLREPQELRDQELSAVRRVIESGWYILGNEVEAFEQEWAEKIGAEQAVGVASGMDAIEIGLRALDVGRGDEVITTSMTAFATVLAIIRAGAIPVLADIDPNTGNLSLESAARCVSKATRAVLLVHLYGRIGDMNGWQAFCNDRGLLLLEDCAQAHLAKWQGRSAGTFGSFGAFSFYPTKNLGAIGDAGLVTSANADIADAVRRLRNYGQSDRYHHTELGMNSRLDELQAAILRVRLRFLEDFTERRRAIAEEYWTQIGNPKVELLTAPQQSENHVHHLFVLRCQDRDELAEHLKSRGIASLIHYPVPVHLQKPCRELRRDPSGLEAAERHARWCLSIPCHPQLSPSEVESIISTVNDF